MHQKPTENYTAYFFRVTNAKYSSMRPKLIPRYTIKVLDMNFYTKLQQHWSLWLISAKMEMHRQLDLKPSTHAKSRCNSFLYWSERQKLSKISPKLELINWIWISRDTDAF